MGIPSLPIPALPSTSSENPARCLTQEQNCPIGTTQSGGGGISPASSWSSGSSPSVKMNV